MAVKTTRTIEVEGSFRRVSYIDPTGSRRLLGIVKSDDYSKEGRRMMFNAAPSNPFARKKGLDAYALGFGSKHLAFIDPADSMQLLTEDGWVIKDQVAAKGGLQMLSVFSHPDMVVPDELHFDEDVWDNTLGGHMNFGCMLTTSVIAGMVAARYMFGWFRPICGNGLAIKIMGFPTLSFRHSEWDADKIRASVQGILNSGTDSYTALGPQVARAGSMKRAVKVLRDYIDSAEIDLNSDGDDVDEEQLEDTARRVIPIEYEVLERQFGAISPNMLKPRVLAYYLQMLDRLTDDRVDRAPIHALELACAYTSAVNIYRGTQENDAGAFRALWSSEGVINLTTTLSSLATLFSQN